MRRRPRTWHAGMVHDCVRLVSISYDRRRGARRGSSVCGVSYLVFSEVKELERRAHAIQWAKESSLNLALNAFSRSTDAAAMRRASTALIRSGFMAGDLVSACHFCWRGSSSRCALQ